MTMSVSESKIDSVSNALEFSEAFVAELLAEQGGRAPETSPVDSGVESAGDMPPRPAQI